MSQDTDLLRRLRDLPMSERREALEEQVAMQFKRTLMMDDDEELPMTDNYFGMGLTSLRISEIKERLEALLGRTVRANILFSQPTVEHLLRYLTTDVLADVFDPTAAEPAGHRTY